MKQGRRAAVCILAAVLALILAACGGVSSEDVTAYIQGELDASYLGQYNEDYLELLDLTEEEAEEAYQAWVASEADWLLYYIDVQYYDDQVLAEAEELVRAIYAKSSYTVGDTNKLKDGNFVTEVLIRPVEVMYLLDETAIQDIYAEVCGEAGLTTYDQISALSEEEYNALEVEYAYRVLAELEALLPQISYGEEQSIMVQMELGEDNNYTMLESDWMDMNEVIIDYGGVYLP